VERSPIADSPGTLAPTTAPGRPDVAMGAPGDTATWTPPANWAPPAQSDRLDDRVAPAPGPLPVSATTTASGAAWPPPTAAPVNEPMVHQASVAVRERGDDRPTAASTGASTLVARGVSCWFGARKVLEDVDLEMLPARITALIGPSGCGKSTFLRSLNRMHELIPGASLAGSITLDGREIYGTGALPTVTRSLIGMVFQRPNPFPSMSIAENVLAGIGLSGRRAANHEEIVETNLRRVGLWTETKDRLHSSGASLSGGQQQRLCIARALAVEPRVLLMDEPCSALDPISTAVIEDTMLSIRHEVTIVIVTHNMQQANRVSDDCALFLVDGEDQPGHIVEAGPTTKLFGDPDDERTLDYISGRFG